VELEFGGGVPEYEARAAPSSQRAQLNARSSP
jgi:hypothetical protein